MKSKLFIILIMINSFFLINLYATFYVETNDLNYQIEGIANNTEITARNTNQTPLAKTDLDELINIILSFVAAVGTFFTFYAIRNESKQQKINEKFQRKIISDLIRHFYRNKIVINAITIVYKTNIINNPDNYQECFDSMYPSEENLLKLKVLPEDLRFEKFDSFNTNTQFYDLLHQIGLSFRAFNIEVDTALLHLKNRNISSGIKLRDLEALDFKMQYFVFQLLYLKIRMGYLVKDKKSKRAKEYKAIEKKFVKKSKRKDSNKEYTLNSFYSNYNELDENIKRYLEKKLSEELYDSTICYNKNDKLNKKYLDKVRELRVESVNLKNADDSNKPIYSTLFNEKIHRHNIFDNILKDCDILDTKGTKSIGVSYLNYQIAKEIEKLSFIEFEK